MPEKFFETDFASSRLTTPPASNAIVGVGPPLFASAEVAKIDEEAVPTALLTAALEDLARKGFARLAAKAPSLSTPVAAR